MDSGDDDDYAHDVDNVMVMKIMKVMMKMMMVAVMVILPSGSICQGLRSYKSCLFRPNIFRTTRSAKVL